MEIAHILEELAYDMGQLPREAIEASIAKKEQITPYLLDILKDAIDRIDEIIEHDNYQGHLYAMYLLAQFRDTAAYPLILRLFSFPGEIPTIIAGDVLTEDLCRILASVSGGDISPLKQMIETPSVNEYVRAAASSAMVTLVGCGILSRTEVLPYFQSLFKGRLERHPSFVWDNLVSSCCDLYPEEVYPEIQQAFEQKLIDPSFISLEDVGAILTERKENHLFRLFSCAELIEDTVSEMEKWLSSNDTLFLNQI
ncbi:MAG: hypothetical protein S4CHLAM45_13370 [Chlamydiales bacterium]|nr:hypothetical protein [Chlamydiales bacterium]MCH9620591.1 hypothetical protein [Chlamydiales bacterium]MCH9623427.1 hypothetical protein [Chlamydiales bacterium]